MPSIAKLVQKNIRLQQQGKLTPAPEEPEIPESRNPVVSAPAPILTGLPIRGTWQPGAILATDFANSTRQGAPVRSHIFPPQDPPNFQGSFFQAQAAILQRSSILTTQVKSNSSAISGIENTPVAQPNPVGGVSSGTIGGGGRTGSGGKAPSRLLQIAVDPTIKGNVKTTGSVYTTISDTFSYTSTTSSITWTWPTIVLRADASATVIPAGSMTFSGLTANTTYFFYPAYLEPAGYIVWLGGANATATLAIAAAQIAQNVIPMSIAAVSGATTASGSGGGTGGGAGGGAKRNIF